MKQPDTDDAEKPTTKTVFIVSHGSYSDYSIRSIWTTREAAEREAGAKRDEWDGPWIEEWVLNTTAPKPVIQWSAHLDDTGEIVVSERPIEVQQIRHTEVEWAKAAFSRPEGWVGWGYGPSADHARKNLADALAKAKAERAGI